MGKTIDAWFTGIALAATVLSACTFQRQFHLGTSAPAYSSDGAAETEARAQAKRDREAEVQAERDISQRYDGVLDALADAEALASQKRLEDAAKRYREAETLGQALIASFDDHDNKLGRAPSARYATAHDAQLDEAMLLEKLHDAMTRAHRELGPAWHMAVAQLAKELHAQSSAQRTVLQKLGRPEVKKSQRTTCWQYRGDTADETYCWDKRGTLARHQKTVRPTQLAQRARRPARVASAAGEPAVVDAPAEAPAEAVPAPAPEPEPTHTPGVAIRRAAAAIYLRRKGLPQTDADNLRDGNCSYIAGFGATADLQSMAERFCEGGSTCSTVTDSDLNAFCYVDQPNYCNSIVDSDLNHLCAGKAFCYGISDPDVRALCEQIP